MYSYFSLQVIEMLQENLLLQTPITNLIIILDKEIMDLTTDR